MLTERAEMKTLLCFAAVISWSCSSSDKKAPAGAPGDPSADSGVDASADVSAPDVAEASSDVATDTATQPDGPSDSEADAPTDGSIAETGSDGCQPDCVGKSCGDDSCGGTCGECLTGESCDAGACVAPWGGAWAGIPAGSFMMGCSPSDADCADDEKPAHNVTLSTFEMLQTEVTMGQYCAVMPSAAVCSPPPDNAAAALPNTTPTWTEAQAFCNAVGGRLPTEAQWEYAARGGTTTRFYCGDDPACLDDVEWFGEQPGNTLHAVKGKPPNAFGLYDLLGNAMEWTWDWVEPGYYGNSPTDDPEGPASGYHRVIRGGTFGSPATNLRVSARFLDYAPWNSYGPLGFRCSRSRSAVACSGQQCGEDPYGNPCGTCGASETCWAGTCEDPYWVDTATGLMWENPNAVATTPPYATFDVSKTYCDDLVLSGYSDWRLPTIQELRSLIRGCASTVTGGACNVSESGCLSNQCYDMISCSDVNCWQYEGPGGGGMYWPTELHGDCGYPGGAAFCSFWSSTPVADATENVWMVGFATGSIGGNWTGNQTYFRCVRQQ